LQHPDSLCADLTRSGRRCKYFASNSDPPDVLSASFSLALMGRERLRGRLVGTSWPYTMGRAYSRAWPLAAQRVTEGRHRVKTERRDQAFAHRFASANSPLSETIAAIPGEPLATLVFTGLFAAYGAFEL
jgi:hypothetical protein